MLSAGGPPQTWACRARPPRSRAPYVGQTPTAAMPGRASRRRRRGELMKAMVLDRPGELLRLAELPVPQPGAGQILVKVKACAVCRTDLHVVDGELPEPKLPLVPGHEIVGEVARLGSGVDRFRPGERVGCAGPSGASRPPVARPSAVRPVAARRSRRAPPADPAVSTSRHSAPAPPPRPAGREPGAPRGCRGSGRAAAGSRAERRRRPRGCPGRSPCRASRPRRPRPTRPAEYADAGGVPLRAARPGRRAVPVPARRRPTPPRRPPRSLWRRGRCCCRCRGRPPCSPGPPGGRSASRRGRAGGRARP